MKLWNGCNIIVSGIKNNSLGSHSPISKIRNLSIANDGTIHSNVQSPENQIILKMAIGTETKALLHGEFIQQIANYKKESVAAINNNKSTILGSRYKAMMMTM